VNAEDFLRVVYAHFDSKGEWPTVQSLQTELRHVGDVRLIATRIGNERVVCQDGATGVCFLTLTGLDALPEAASDTANAVAMIRQLALHAIQRGVLPTSSAEIATALNLAPPELARAGLILYHDHNTWSQWSGSDHGFIITPRDDAVFYERVSSVHDVTAIRERRAREGLERGRMIAERISVSAEPRTVVTDATVRGDLMAREAAVNSGWLSKLVAKLERENSRRGILWTVLAVLLGLILAALAL
jgi:hypothetical protein